MSARTIFGKQWKPYPPPVASHKGREKVTEKKKIVINKTVVINSDASIGYLEPFKGKTLVGIRLYDTGTAAMPEKEAYVLEFSDDEPAQEQLLTIEEQRDFFDACKRWAIDGKDSVFYEPCKNTIRRVFTPDVDGGE